MLGGKTTKEIEYIMRIGVDGSKEKIEGVGWCLQIFELVLNL